MNVFECYNEIDVLSLADKFRVFLRSSHDCEKKASRDELRALVDLRTELKVDDSVFKKPLRKFFSNMAKEAEFTNEVHTSLKVLLLNNAGEVLGYGIGFVNDVPAGENITGTMYAITAPHSLDSLADMAMFSCPTLE